MNTGSNITYYIHTLGCKVNQYDSYYIEELLNASGFTSAPNQENADIIIINSCTVTNTADKKSRMLIRGARRRNPHAKVVVCGCMASVGTRELLQIGKIDAVVPNDKRENIIDIIKNCLDADFNDCHWQSQTVMGALSGETEKRTRRYIKIQDGCNNNCAYCIIPRARGASVSREISGIIEEIKNLREYGVKEFILTGIHICSYQSGKYDLLRLLQTLSDIVSQGRLRLGSLDPRFISDEWITQASQIKNLCPHFHISLQSGSDNILNKMGRGYSAGYYSMLIDKIRKLWGNPAITTDIITGFPGESEDDFFETVNFVRRNKFARVHVFPYSERAGTSAAAMKGSIPVNVRKERAGYLIGVVQSVKDEFIDSCLGKVDEVIFETQCGEFTIGHTSRYVKACAAGVMPGEFKKVCPTRRLGDMLECKIIG